MGETSLISTVWDLKRFSSFLVSSFDPKTRLFEGFRDSLDLMPTTNSLESIFPIKVFSYFCPNDRRSIVETFFFFFVRFSKKKRRTKVSDEVMNNLDKNRSVGKKSAARKTGWMIKTGTHSTNFFLQNPTL